MRGTPWCTPSSPRRGEMPSHPTAHLTCLGDESHFSFRDRVRALSCPDLSPQSSSFPKLRLQGLGGVRVLHGRHPQRLQRTFCPQTRPQLPVDRVHRQDSLPAAWNSTSSPPASPRGKKNCNHAELRLNNSEINTSSLLAVSAQEEPSLQASGPPRTSRMRL